MIDTLYHYCSVESFHAIISGKTIRLSDLSSSNDSQEGNYGIGLLCKELQKRYGYLESPANMILNLIASQVRAGGFCMSAKCDFLSQWRGYANDGHGFAIGFNKLKLDLLYLKPIVELDKTNLIRVDYGETSRTALLDSICLKFHDFYQVAKANKLNIDNYKSKELIELASCLYQFIFSVKTPGFMEEEEWRLYTCLFKDYSNVRASYKGLVSFSELPLIDNQNLVTHVLIGPKNTSPKKVVESFLKSNGFDDTAVLTSSISYR